MGLLQGQVRQQVGDRFRFINLPKISPERGMALKWPWGRIATQAGLIELTFVSTT